jgi:hypothetical protein
LKGRAGVIRLRRGLLARRGCVRRGDAYSGCQQNAAVSLQNVGNPTLYLRPFEIAADLVLLIKM